MKEITMTCITTASGVTFDLRHPDRSTIHIADIAHHLAQLNRFTGAAARPMSVAEHSLLVAEIAEREFGLRGAALLAALLHDAHEAYASDLATPAKRVVGGAWFNFEHRLAHVVTTRFAVHAAAYEARDEIAAADAIALATEKAQLMPPSPPWPSLAGVEPYPIDLLEPGRCAMAWLDWRQAFLDRFAELEFTRLEQVEPSPVDPDRRHPA